MVRGQYIRTSEIKKKISESMVGKKKPAHSKRMIGNCYNFKGGDQKYWKHQALLRDNYTCQICGFRDEEIMIIDHKLPKSMYPELKFDLNNLQTLCPNCNQRKTIREKKQHNYKIR